MTGTIKSLDDIRTLLNQYQLLFVRWSKYPRKDCQRGYSIDHVTGKKEPGLSAVRVTPDMDDATLYRRLVEYSYLGGTPWLLTGDTYLRDTDGYYAVINPRYIARVGQALIKTARQSARQQDWAKGLCPHCGYVLPEHLSRATVPHCPACRYGK
jgi:hypothetical protein